MTPVAAQKIAQTTLKNSVRASGVGLHSGQQINLRISPALPGTGILFCRTDIAQASSRTIRATAQHVVATAMSTTLAEGDACVGTVEHLMAAFAGSGIDNALVEVDAPELPIMDGSAAPFLFLLQSAGIATQSVPRQYLRIRKQIRYTEGDVSVQLEPYEGFRIGYTLMYDHPVFRAHNKSAVVDFPGLPGQGSSIPALDNPQQQPPAVTGDSFRTIFEREISRARTFGFMADIERLQEMNLARGGSLDNAVVVDETGILNVGGLRSDDEFVKHKILDALGDLYLLGYPIIGAFTGHKSGHRANNQLARMLLAEPSAYELVSFAGDELADVVTDAAV